MCKRREELAAKLEILLQDKTIEDVCQLLAYHFSFDDTLAFYNFVRKEDGLEKEEDDDLELINE